MRRRRKGRWAKQDLLLLAAALGLGARKCSSNMSASWTSGGSGATVDVQLPILNFEYHCKKPQGQNFELKSVSLRSEAPTLWMRAIKTKYNQIKSASSYTQPLPPLVHYHHKHTSTKVRTDSKARSTRVCWCIYSQTNEHPAHTLAIQLSCLQCPN